MTLMCTAFSLLLDHVRIGKTSSHHFARSDLNRRPPDCDSAVRMIDCCETLPLEDNSHCRNKSIIRRCSCSYCKVQDFNNRPLRSCRLKPSLEHVGAKKFLCRRGPSIPCSELPQVQFISTERASTSKQCPAGVQDHVVPQVETPLLIHGYPVEEYQNIYHSVVDAMLRNKGGSPRLYSLGLGRKIKKGLWRKLNGPKLTMKEETDGHMTVSESYVEGVHPPPEDVVVSGSLNLLCHQPHSPASDSTASSHN